MIQLVRVFATDSECLQIKIAMIGIAVQEDLANMLALVNCSIKLCSWVA